MTYRWRAGEVEAVVEYAPYVMREEEDDLTRRLTSKERAALAEKFDPDKCGDYAGWNQHQALGVPTCDKCRAAFSEYQRQYRAKRKGRRDREKLQ